MRYIRGCSAFGDYMKMKHAFYHRLRDRGYPPHFLFKIMDSVTYSQRSQLLKQKIEVKNVAATPLIFTSRYHPSVSHASIKHAVCGHWNKYMQKVYGNRPIIGYKRTKNIKEYLMKSKYVSPPLAQDATVHM